VPQCAFQQKLSKLRAGQTVQTGVQVVREKQDFVQQGLNIDGDVFGMLCEEIFPPFSLNFA
jgi:hypothetical protein